VSVLKAVLLGMVAGSLWVLTTCFLAVLYDWWKAKRGVEEG
jgi:hypothetical protein